MSVGGHRQECRLEAAGETRPAGPVRGVVVLPAGRRPRAGGRRRHARHHGPGRVAVLLHLAPGGPGPGGPLPAADHGPVRGRGAPSSAPSSTARRGGRRPHAHRRLRQPGRDLPVDGRPPPEPVAVPGGVRRAGPVQGPHRHQERAGAHHRRRRGRAGRRPTPGWPCCRSWPGSWPPFPACSSSRSASSARPWVVRLAAVGFAAAAIAARAGAQARPPGAAAAIAGQGRGGAARHHHPHGGHRPWRCCGRRSGSSPSSWPSPSAASDAPSWWFGVVLAASLVGHASSATWSPPACAGACAEERILLGSLLAGGGGGRSAGRPGRPWSPSAWWPAPSGVAAAAGKLAFDSIVQRDAPDAIRGRTFARFETRFQLVWVVGRRHTGRPRDLDPHGHRPHRPRLLPGLLRPTWAASCRPATAPSTSPPASTVPIPGELTPPRAGSGG